MGEWLKAFLRRRDGLSLRGVSESWQSYVLSSKGVVRLRVVSTKTLTADQKGMVTERLEATWPKVEIMWDTDAEVIGGIKCYLNDLVLDLSLQGALHRIALAFDTRG
jgi:F0F1-type ATP synthase delta subunit